MMACTVPSAAENLRQREETIAQMCYSLKSWDGERGVETWVFPSCKPLLKPSAYGSWRVGCSRAIGLVACAGSGYNVLDLGTMPQMRSTA